MGANSSRLWPKTADNSDVRVCLAGTATDDGGDDDIEN